MRFLHMLMPEIEYIDTSRWNDFSWADALLFDVAFFQRCSATYELKQMQILKEYHKKIWLDYDDDLINIEQHNPAYKLYAPNKKILTQIYGIADVITVSTETLRQTLLPYNKNVVVIPNAHNDYLYKVENKPKFSYNKKAFYRGGHTHQFDLFKHKDGIIKMIRENPDWDFLFMSDRYSFIEKPLSDVSNHYIVDMLPLTDFFGAIYKMNCCVGMTFLEDTPFNQAKSNIAFIESAYAGGAVFAPLSMKEFDKTPCIHFENVSEAFSYMKEQDDLRAVHDRSWEYITDNLLLSNVNKKRIEILKSII